MTEDSWEHRMAARARARAAERRVEEIAARGDPFAPWRRPDDPIDILPAIIAARCLGISYGDPGPKLPADVCGQCWGERFVWFGNCWGLQHVGQRVGEYRRCDHSCHDDEVLLADGSGPSAPSVAVMVKPLVSPAKGAVRDWLDGKRRLER